MVEYLALAGAPAFEQDRIPWVAAGPGQPGCRRLNRLRVVTLRHTVQSVAAEAALEGIGLALPPKTRDMSSTGTLHAARRQPEETLVLGPNAPVFDALLGALPPGLHADAVALDLSHGLAVIELEGPHLDGWLSHLVDVQAIPAAPGQASQSRLVDVAVQMLRLAPDRLWLVVDRALCPYLADWLRFAHQGAFETFDGLSNR